MWRSILPSVFFLGAGGLLALARAILAEAGDGAGKLLLIDTLALRFRTLMLPKDPGCPACGG